LMTIIQGALRDRLNQVFIYLLKGVNYMAHDQAFAFPFGQAVTAVTQSGNVFAGTLLGIRHHNESSQRIQLLFIRLTTAVGPYTIGEVVALNTAQIESIGPIAIT